MFCVFYITLRAFFEAAYIIYDHGSIFFKNKLRRLKSSNKLNLQKYAKLKQPVNRSIILKRIRMGSPVDVELRYSTTELFLSYLREEGVKNDKSDKEKAVEQGVKDFFSILQDAIAHKLEFISYKKKDLLTITAKSLVQEGQGSVEICDPPSEAQQQLVRSLLKVVLHQFNNKRNDFFVSDGNYNLFLSIFINKISVDTESITIRESHLFDSTDLSSKTIISEILSGSYEQLEFSGLHKKNCNHYYFYLLSNPPDFESSNILTSEFDKIDLDDSNTENLEESTIVKDLNKYSLPFAEETLKNVKVTRLPSTELDGLWESLYFENNVKQKIFSHGEASTKISDFLHSITYNNEATKVLENNKLILLHGPPGSGKTTLCRAIAQKFVIRKKYPNIMASLNTDCKGLLIELSCARIFSRWFGESSKNLESIFNDLKRILSSPEYQHVFVYVLIDEVETIAGSRKEILSKNESSDSVRVVNTLLTQIDSLKPYKNFFIMATSNLIDSLDPAFVDRADGVFYIGSPSQTSISNILTSMIKSLIQCKIIGSRSDTNITTDSNYNKIIKSLGQECFVCKSIFQYSILQCLITNKNLSIEFKFKW